MQLSPLKSNPQPSSYLERATAYAKGTFEAGKGAVAQRPLLARVGAYVPAAAASVAGGLVGLAATPVYAVEKVASKSFLSNAVDFVGAAAFGAVALAGFTGMVTYLTGTALPSLTIGQGAMLALQGAGLAVFGKAAIDSIVAYGTASAGKTMSFIASGFDRFGVGAKKA
ncbi:MAG: hypothetical protein ACAI38_00550 [Myxococcota bacterium]